MKPLNRTFASLLARMGALALFGGIPMAAHAQTTQPHDADTPTTRPANWGQLLVTSAPTTQPGQFQLVIEDAQLTATADTGGSLEALYTRTKPSLVAVKYQWESELQKREVVGSGIVVREDGLVLIPLSMVPGGIPDAQMKEFKIVIPREDQDDEEIDATFAGRDERSNVAFVQAKGDRKWPAVQFKDAPLAIGETVYGVGLLPKAAGYHAFLNRAMISAKLRGELPQILVEAGGLSNVGSPVFNAAGDAVGVVYPQSGQEGLLDNANELNGLVAPPHFFVPSHTFLNSLQNPPSPGHPLRVPWIGITQWTGVNKQFAEFLGLKNQPAAQIGDIVPNGPADRAGLKQENIIVKMNGQPLERGDLPDEIPQIIRRRLLQMNVGDKVTFTILPEKGQPMKEVTVTLEERPKQPNQADRYYAQDLGFVAREPVFSDTYLHKLKANAPGVVVDLMKPGGAAASAKLSPEDFIVQMNGKHVTDLPGFKADYEAFRRDHAHDSVVLVVHRLGGRQETINIEPPQSDAAPAPAPGDTP